MAMRNAILKVDEEFVKWAKSHRRVDDSGACIVACLMRGSHLAVAWAGDCRGVLYIPSPFSPQSKVLPLTVDHSTNNPKEQARLRTLRVPIKEGRVFGVLMPTRSLGDVRQKEEMVGGIIAECETADFTLPYIRHFSSTEKKKVKTDSPSGRKKRHSRRHTLPEKPFLLLASDGVWGCMTNERAVETIKELLFDPNVGKGAEKKALRSLCERANMMMGDDTSAILVEFLKSRRLDSDLLADDSPDT
eukprot:CAMPEP_0119154108 /NCGR_PEP_ID=MMETSP1310-20130426/50320_1 /TAXON_ID=464262 /ORGANISM="Genus nov. species nov., Strain RCC2339" /LENGTH=245 /DNA_ID=CAMNT_0007146613 /DNA_START=13 /DNA_END=746 /DNA_ORIENTATION=+